MSTNETKSLTPMERVDALKIADSAKIAALKTAVVRESVEAYVKGEVLVSAAVSKAGAAVEDVRRKQATAIGKLTHEVIREAGFKTLSDLCKAVDLCDQSKQTLSQLSAAGRVYNDPEAPENLKALSPSKLGQMGVLIRDKDAYTSLKNAASAGEVNGDMTLDSVKSYVEAHRPVTAKVLPTFGAKVNGEYIKESGEIAFKTVSDWLDWFPGEVVKLPENAQGERRILSIIEDGNHITLYTLAKREKPAAKPKDNAPKLSIADMAKLLGVSVEALTALKQAKE